VWCRCQLITSGSSFSFVAATMSYKPVVLFDRPKEGLFFGVYMDADYVKLDNGRIAEQSLSEVRPPHTRLAQTPHVDKLGPPCLPGATV
jgi:hypothetical protein